MTEYTDVMDILTPVILCAWLGGFPAALIGIAVAHYCVYGYDLLIAAVMGFLIGTGISLFIFESGVGVFSE